MPLYAYRCKDCGNEFEARQRMMDEPLSDCPACGGDVRRVINQVGVVFKGSGFYVTDTKSQNPAAPATANGSGEKSDTTEKKTAEDKPADSPAPKAEKTEKSTASS